MITGLDLSEKNGQIDWDLLTQEEVDFIYFKASEGVNQVDSMVKKNLKASRQNNIMTGAYHWLRPELHVGQQVDLFVSTVKDFNGMLSPLVCVQVNPNKSEDIIKNIQTFFRLLEQRLQIKPLVYISEKSWKLIQTESSWGCDYPLWIDQPGKTWPKQLWPWAGWTFWQYSYQARMPGISNEIGLNWFNGSREELAELLIQ